MTYFFIVYVTPKASHGQSRSFVTCGECNVTENNQDRKFQILSERASQPSMITVRYCMKFNGRWAMSSSCRMFFVTLEGAIFGESRPSKKWYSGVSLARRRSHFLRRTLRGGLGISQSLQGPPGTKYTLDIEDFLPCVASVYPKAVKSCNTTFLSGVPVWSVTVRVCPSVP